MAISDPLPFTRLPILLKDAALLLELLSTCFHDGVVAGRAGRAQGVVSRAQHRQAREAPPRRHHGP